MHMWWKAGPQEGADPGTAPNPPTSLKPMETANWWSWRKQDPTPSNPGDDTGKDADSSNPGTESSTAPEDTVKQSKAVKEGHSDTNGSTGASVGASSDENTQMPPVGADPTGPEPANSSGRSWAFWGSKNSSQLAVSGTDSENNPLPADVEAPAKKPRTQIPSTLVPTFDQSFSYPPLMSRFWAKHPYRTAPKHIKKAVVVGVHGYFPARIARTFLGEPTGTSIKFATEGANMLEDWAATNGFKIEVEKIALEGEGRIAEREYALFELLKNWMDTLRKADFIFFAVHSQGAVVGVHIIARLIEEYKISAKIGLLAMAGVCLGPMPGMDQRYVMKAISTIENASLLELFELQNPESVQSQKYRQDLSAVLRHGVKTVFVASADDQLVPLYSALCTQADHPNIFRAVYLDGDTISPKFLAPLLSLAVRRRNSGHSDHGFFADVSNSIAGSLTGGGHSRLYSSDQVYTLALRTILETSSTTKQSPKFHDFSLPKQNPYLLPWSVHAMLTDAAGAPDLAENVEQLYRDYGTWKPNTKPMKDLKYRLAALKKTKL